MERFEITTQQERRRVGPLFDGIDDSLIKTFLQGYAGQAWCDDLSYPRCAAIHIQDFLFFGGFPDSENAPEFAATVPEGHKGLNVVACDPGWLPLVQAAHGGKCAESTRYAMQLNPKTVDKESLRATTRKLPEGCALLGMDEEIYEMAMKDAWSRDLCSFFADADDYVERGIGFCVLHGEELVAGASSFSIYDGGIEVQISTRDDHRRMGLARACGAALVLACVSQSRMPCWDAANEASLALAQSLGYTLKNEYSSLYIEG